MTFLSSVQQRELRGMLEDLQRTHGVRMEVHLRGARDRQELGLPAAVIARRELDRQRLASPDAADALLLVILAGHEFAVAVDSAHWIPDPVQSRWNETGMQMSASFTAGQTLEGIRRLVRRMPELLAHQSQSH